MMDSVPIPRLKEDRDMLTLKKRPARQEPSQSPAKPAPERMAEASGDRADEVRLLAYRKWEEAGSPTGDGVEFWLTAEAELLHGRRR
jgi:hypothetical protein